MSNINFFRVLQNFTANAEAETVWPTLTCSLELGDFSTAGTGHIFPNYSSFYNYGGLYHQQTAIGSRYPGDGNMVHYMYTSWFGTSSISDGPPYKQLVYQFMMSQSDNRPPDISNFEKWVSPTKNTASLSLSLTTIGSVPSNIGNPNFASIQAIQVPNTGSLAYFTVKNYSKTYITQYDLDTNFDMTTLNSSSRKIREIAKLTASSGNIGDQIAFGYTGSHLYQFTRNRDGNNSPYPTWTVCTVFHLATPYEMWSSTHTSSFIVEDILELGPYPSADTQHVNCTAMPISSSTEPENGLVSSSFFYTNYVNDYVANFTVKPDGAVNNSSITTLGVSDFPSHIHYIAPYNYGRIDDDGASQFGFMISRSLSPNSGTSNLNQERTGSCLSPYIKLIANQSV
jgi:hypothetical protein